MSGSAMRCLRSPGEANAPGWWHRYSDVLPSWFQVYIGLEGAATLIRSYDIQFVPGLLQTRTTPGRSCGEHIRPCRTTNWSAGSGCG